MNGRPKKKRKMCFPCVHGCVHCDCGGGGGGAGGAWPSGGRAVGISAAVAAATEGVGVLLCVALPRLHGSGGEHHLILPVLTS